MKTSYEAFVYSKTFCIEKNKHGEAVVFLRLPVFLHIKRLPCGGTRLAHINFSLLAASAVMLKILRGGQPVGRSPIEFH